MENINFNKRKVFKNDLKKSLHNNLMENNFNFIKLGKNSKLPVNKWGDKANQHKEQPDMAKYNVGIPTGEINDIVVIDIDIKDDGLKEWQTYTAEFGDPITPTVKTPSGGYHYYFKRISKSEHKNECHTVPDNQH